MKMCQDHWTKLRHAIQARGLGDRVAGSGQEAAKQAIEELEGKPKTRQYYDPLIGAHNSIVCNAMDMLKNLGLNPLPLLCSDPEHPEWECPICYLNYLSEEHDRTCTNPDCTKEKGVHFESWIDKAADGAAEYAKTLSAE